ncbi:MAG: hypothetical protein KatS3mg105_4469 [Gemmatales bacterium]|nr:MAG: hypothetical protein KatS3mg105_4469 [Gemmatales bacterium]
MKRFLAKSDPVMETTKRAKPRRLSLIIPAYNEAEVIEQAIREADDALGRLADEFEIIVVDDGSRDKTADIVERLRQQHRNVRLLRHPENRGYGAALRTGFQAARFDLVAFTDADCQFYLDDLSNLIALADRFPIVAGYRVGRQDSRLRCFLSRGYNWLARLLLGTRVCDVDCALKVFRRNTLQQILPQSTGFFVNTEMFARARKLGLPVVQHGVRHRPRLKGRSKVSLSDIPRTLLALIPFWWAQLLR